MILKRGIALSDILVMPKINKEAASSIRNIWNEYHAAQPFNVSTVISSLQFDELDKRATDSPYFIFPVLRKRGHFLLMSKYKSKTVSFTYNDEPAYMSLEFFTEMSESKRIVPVRGSIEDFKISKTEAETLKFKFLEYYLEKKLYDDYIHQFNHYKDDFEVSEFLNFYFSRKTT